MPYVFEDRVNIIKQDSKPIVPHGTYSAGTRLYKIDFRGNSLLSTLFIGNLNGGTVTVNYFDFTTGGDATPTLERFDLQGHTTPTTAATSDRILVTQLHNKVVAEVIVTGDPEFGLYVTIVDFSASDIDNALVKDSETANLLLNKGMIQAFYNPSTGTLQFGRIDNEGNICVKNTVVGDIVGTSVYFDATDITSTPGVQQTLISFTVPALTTRYLRNFLGSCQQPGRFTVELSGAIIGTGRTGPGESNTTFDWGESPRPISAGSTVNVKFLSPSFAPATCVDFHLVTTDVT